MPYNILHINIYTHGRLWNDIVLSIRWILCSEARLWCCYIIINNKQHQKNSHWTKYTFLFQHNNFALTLFVYIRRKMECVSHLFAPSSSPSSTEQYLTVTRPSPLPTLRFIFSNCGMKRITISFKIHTSIFRMAEHFSLSLCHCYVSIGHCHFFSNLRFLMWIYTSNVFPYSMYCVKPQVLQLRVIINHFYFPIE